MNIRIVCVGNLKEKYFVQASDEYLKRLSKFANVSVIELKEERLRDDNDIERVKQKETDEILKNLQGYNILMDIGGVKLSSPDFAKRIKKISDTSSTITYIIGGSYGVADKLREVCDLRLSISDMTFPHQLARVILLEQIYRAYMILNNSTYHK